MIAGPHAGIVEDHSVSDRVTGGAVSCYPNCLARHLSL